ncbi:hypothetical protein [Tsukamurella pseudospumae]|uniref:Gas vesicle protein n=1 Tax=Tsukamurella pseudospumae TaxID=239498 RepID=A0A138AIA3_9ACTN|nr:hypothetical protein [Tsukamurella pseudospumae]KXP10142.1 hypothetical protein AXK60_06560 [Tsukamurella pseudospumae]
MSSKNDSEQADEVATQHPAPDDDWMLADLVALVNDMVETEFEIGLTLWTSSGMVSGLLISGFRYFDLLSDALRIDTEGMAEAEARQLHVRNVFADYFGNYKDIYKRHEDSSAEGDDEAGKLSPRPAYMHLRSVRYGPNFPAPREGDVELFWRGRLTEISGWSVSQVGGAQAAPERPF